MQPSQLPGSCMHVLFVLSIHGGLPTSHLPHRPAALLPASIKTHTSEAAALAFCSPA